MDKAAAEKSKKRETVFGYAEQKDNGAHYERLAENRWEAFLNESAALAPYSSKHKKATVLRHAWKRANVLKEFYQSSRDLENMLVHQAFISLAERYYSHVAPQNAYGKVRLKMTFKQHLELVKSEQKRLSPSPAPPKPEEFACIYKGEDTATKRTYIGQTTNKAEERWLQHRKSGTGAFKDGAINVNWEIIQERVIFNELDYWESYYIGYYNSLKLGFNDNRGNDLDAYDKGIEDARMNNSL
ncbi:MAG: hypothetical protein ACJ0BK_00765 [Coraliomargaritaceae bacterium]